MDASKDDFGPVVFHGTSARSAEKIIKEGFKPNLFIPAVQNYIRTCHIFGMPNAHSELDDLLSDLKRIGSKHTILVPNVIASMADAPLARNFEYGETYVTTHPKHAASYAKKGSELLRAVREIQRYVALRFGMTVARKIGSEFQDLLNWAEDDGAKCILAIELTKNHTIFNENGSTANLTQVSQCLERSNFVAQDQIEFRSAFRVDGLGVKDIRGFFISSLVSEKVYEELCSLGPDKFISILQQLNYWKPRM